MSFRQEKAKGFTLVEILIVVVILGILAAIVIPQFTNASEAAKASNLVSQLQSIRSQLELFQLQHNGDYPIHTLMDDFEALTSKTLVDGTIAAATDTDTFGPYLQKAPVNPFTAGGNGDVVTVTDTGTAVPNATAAVGWVYNSATGEIRASMESGKADEVGMDELDGDIKEYTTATP